MYSRDLGCGMEGQGLLWWLSGKKSACNVGDAGDTGLIPEWGRSPGGGHVTHSSILAWRILWTEEPGGQHTAHGVVKSWTRLKQLSTDSHMEGQV